MYTTFLFDFYDVIRIDPYKKWLNDHSFTRDGEFYDIAARYDRGMIDFEELLQGLGELSGETSEEVDRAFKAANNFDDEVIALIEKLAIDFKIGMISNAGGPGLRRILNEKGIEKLFREIVISGEVGHIKPEPEIFNIALEKLESNPQETIFIDDNEHNCEAALDLGITSIQFVSYRQLIQSLGSLGVSV